MLDGEGAVPEELTDFIELSGWRRTMKPANPGLEPLKLVP